MEDCRISAINSVAVVSQEQYRGKLITAVSAEAKVRVGFTGPKKEMTEVTKISPENGWKANGFSWNGAGTGSFDKNV